MAIRSYGYSLSVSMMMLCAVPPALGSATYVGSPPIVSSRPVGVPWPRRPLRQHSPMPVFVAIVNEGIVSERSVVFSNVYEELHLCYVSLNSHKMEFLIFQPSLGDFDICFATQLLLPVDPSEVPRAGSKFGKSVITSISTPLVGTSCRDGD